MSVPAIVWLRDDLRLDDQPAIRAAAAVPALFVHILDERPVRPLGGAGRWWLGKSLTAFAASLARIGGRLDVVAGDPETVLPALARRAGADAVYWTRRYGGAEIEKETRLAAELRRQGVKAQSFNGQLLRDPEQVKTEAGAPFKVFTPFWRRCRELGPFGAPLPAPRKLTAAPWPDDAPARLALPTEPDGSALAQSWTPGEAGAQARLSRFLDQALADYAEARDTLAGETTSRLSPHLRFGEISPRRVVAATEAAAQSAHAHRGADKFLAELGWREFSHTLLLGQPDLARENWNPRFDAFPWRDDPTAFEAWRHGRTGYPVVDAGMRELSATGYMHNRVRLIAGSFLAKHLGLDWRAGEAWFWDRLCDADEASNPANWQWVAGCGADAAPYFRVFNPILQGGKFDAAGAYVRRWVPELARLDARYIHAPWTAPAAALAEAGVRLGRDYPAPIVDHAQARARALAAFASIGSAPAQRSPSARNAAKNSG
ncbi:MAG: deoxyribodipyrimidine photo-lyase [Pseudomonadota bacterium]|nr:deoxyribodipyrimidine photo-lyase [Pseudomonadota bacterium]